MKKTFIFLSFLLPVLTMAQVGIGTGASAPHASAQLEVQSSTRGFLPPRVVLTATNSNSPFTVTPATGLLVYNTATAGTAPNNVTPGFYYYSGTAWVRLIVPTDNAANVTGTVAVANGGTGSTTGSITGTGALTLAAGGTNENVTISPKGTGHTVLNGKVGVGTVSPNAKLDIRTSPTSTSDPGAGFLGIGTTTETAPTAGAGAVRYNSESGGGIEFSNGASWNRLTSSVTKSTVIASKVGNTSESFNHTTVTNVTNWTEILDVNNNFDPATGIFTAPRTGNYSFSFSYKFRAGSIDANSKIEAFMTCSNTAKLRKTATAFPASGTNAEPGAQISFVVNLLEGETLRPSLWHSLGVNKLLLGDDDFNNLSIVEL